MITYKIFCYKEHEITLSAIELFSLRKTEKCNLSDDIVDQIIEWQLNFSDKVIIAYFNNEIAGFFRYDIGNNPKYIYAAGTYVIPKHRKLGLAFSLWEEIIKNHNPKIIFAHIESDGGMNLIKKIKNKYPYIKYDCTLSKKLKAS